MRKVTKYPPRIVREFLIEIKRVYPLDLDLDNSSRGYIIKKLSTKNRALEEVRSYVQEMSPKILKRYKPSLKKP